MTKLPSTGQTGESGSTFSTLLPIGILTVLGLVFAFGVIERLGRQRKERT